MTTAIDLSQLPAPDFIAQQSYEALLADMRAELLAALPASQQESAAQILALESEPLTKLLEMSAYRIMTERQAFNDRSARLMLAYATEDYLDHIGVTYYQTPRLTTSAGAAENDDAYRRRLLLAFDGYSTAGARAAYIYHALSASGDVLDAEVIGARAGVVELAILSAKGTGIAEDALLDTVRAALSAERVRPLNDQVDVRSADVDDYAIRATLTIREGPAKSLVTAAAREAAAAYADSRYRLGRRVVRDAVLASLWVDNVEHVDLISPAADIDRADDQAARCAAVEVDYVE